MQPSRPERRPNCFSWPRPPQIPAPKLTLSHPSIQPGGLHDLQHKQPPPRLVLIFLHVGTQHFIRQFLGSIFMRAFFLCEIIQKLPDTGILGTRRGSFIEPAILDFDSACVLANRVEPEDAPATPACAARMLSRLGGESAGWRSPSKKSAYTRSSSSSGEMARARISRSDNS
jgi:hypothetical protein